MLYSDIYKTVLADHAQGSITYIAYVFVSSMQCLSSGPGRRSSEWKAPDPDTTAPSTLQSDFAVQRYHILQELIAEKQVCVDVSMYVHASICVCVCVCVCVCLCTCTCVSGHMATVRV